MSKKISLEDLMRLKKSERPSESDWARFDVELKRKLMRKAVNDANVFDAVWGFVSAKKSVYVYLSCAAFATAIFASAYIDKNMNLPSYAADSKLASTSPRASLPSVSENFAINEIPSDQAYKESPVFAQIDSHNNLSVRYISSDVGGVSDFVF